MPSFPRSAPAALIGLLAGALSLFVGALPATGSNDPLFPGQWALAKIGAEQAWTAARGDGIKVAVIDTGVDFNHEDLAGKVGGSFNCIKQGEITDRCDPVPGGDDNGHGTQVAGIIGAVQGNGKGIAPVAPGASIMSFKALAADGSGNLSDVIRGIRSAADNGAVVINLSLGPEVNLINDLLNLILGANPEQEFSDAFKYAADKGSLVVAAAGNSGTSSFFGGLENVYVVGSTGPNDEVAFYSSSGAEIFAPGGNSRAACAPEQCINTTSPGGYKAVQGTSFAAPHVSGVAALMMSQGTGAAEARIRINATADVIPNGKRINAARAVSGIGAAVPVPPPEAPPVAPPQPRPEPPPPPPEPLISVPVPAPVDLVPILVLSSSEPADAPRKPVVMSRPRPAPGSAWPAALAGALSGVTLLGHGLFQIAVRKGL